MIITETADGKYRNIIFEPKDTLEEIASRLKNKDVYDLVDMCNKVYSESQNETERLKHMSIDDLAKDDKYKDIFGDNRKEDKEAEEILDSIVRNKKEPVEEKPKLYNVATYIKKPLVSMDGNIWVYPRSNGGLRVDFNDKSKAEAYLKQFRRRISSGDYKVLEFYNDLNLAVPLEINDIANDYIWKQTYNHELTWVSNSANKSVDTSQFGFCITKRASKTKEIYQ